MTAVIREQLLDVGDRVTFDDQEAVVLATDTPGRLILVLPEMQVRSISPAGLERIGEPLQPGDWVRVTGECETIRSTDREAIDDEVGLIVDTYEEEGGPDFLVCVRGLADLYECHAAQLTRITRAEALA